MGDQSCWYYCMIQDLVTKGAASWLPATTVRSSFRSGEAPFRPNFGMFEVFGVGDTCSLWCSRNVIGFARHLGDTVLRREKVPAESRLSKQRGIEDLH